VAEDLHFFVHYDGETFEVFPLAPATAVPGVKLVNGEWQSLTPSPLGKIADRAPEDPVPVAYASNLDRAALAQVVGEFKWDELYLSAVLDYFLNGRKPRHVARDWGVNVGTLKVYCTRVRNRLMAS
jgi:hypothetical protein